MLFLFSDVIEKEGHNSCDLTSVDCPEEAIKDIN